MPAVRIPYHRGSCALCGVSARRPALDRWESPAPVLLTSLSGVTSIAAANGPAFAVVN